MKYIGEERRGKRTEGERRGVKGRVREGRTGWGREQALNKM